MGSSRVPATPCEVCGAEDWEVRRHGLVERLRHWLRYGSRHGALDPVDRRICRRCGNERARGGLHTYGPPGRVRYLLAASSWTAPLRVLRVLHHARTWIPAPWLYLQGAVLGAIVGLVLMRFLGWPWWPFPIAGIAAVWVVFLASIRRHGVNALGTEVLDALTPRRALERHLRRMEAVLRNPPVPLYGLPPSWTGLRFVGGLGGGGMGTEAGVTSIELGHGDPEDRSATHVRVESSLSPGRWTVGELGLREVAESLWHRAERPPPDLPPERLREWAESREHEWHRRQTPRFQTVAIPVDGRKVPFDYLAREGEWVACATIDGVSVTITGRNADVEAIELLHVADVEPYLRGSRELHRRDEDAGGSTATPGRPVS